MTPSDLPSALSDTAMVLAAGQGMRMRPLTLHKPKPLLEIGGRTMLDLALDKLVEAGIRRAVVNVHYLGAMIVDHLASRHDITLVMSPEDTLLDTGGGIKKALHEFGGKPFFALNADLPWTDGRQTALSRLAAAWDPARMDALLLVMRRERARGFHGQGDFMLEADGRLWRSGAPTPRSHVWISAQILKPSLFECRTETAFSNNLVWNGAEATHRLCGLEHDGACFHAGTPEDLAEANRLLASGEGWSVRA